MDARGSASSLPIGGTFDQRFAVVRKLASGGTATVYLARERDATDKTRLVAIKACHPHLLDGTERRAIVLDEARITMRIRHPHVVSTLDVIEESGSLSLVMEYVDGLSAAQLVRAHDDAPLPMGVALRIVHDALAGLGAAHMTTDEAGKPLGVVHRDVSPQNILVGVDGIAKLADFGVFKAEGRSAPSTETGELKGKLGYVAPEVYAGERVSQRADIYGMGVVLWELVAGRRLFEEPSHAAVMYRALAGRVPSVRVSREEAPIEIDAVLARALARDPNDRFASAEDFARALTKLPVPMAATPEVAARVSAARVKLGTDASADEYETPSDHVTPITSTPRRARVRTTSIAAAIATVAVLGAVMMTRRNEPPRAPVSSTAATVAAPSIVPTPPPAIVAEAAPTAAPEPVPRVAASAGASAGPSASARDGGAKRPPPVKPRTVRTKAPPRSSSDIAAPQRRNDGVFDPEEL